MYGYDENKKAEIKAYLKAHGMSKRSSFTMREIEQIARHDPRLFDGFVHDVLEDMGATVLKECEQYGGLTRAEIEQAILKVIKAAADEWEQMTPEEQKEVFDIEEIDKARAEAISRNEQKR